MGKFWLPARWWRRGGGLILLSALLAALWWQGWLGGSRRLYRLIKNQPELVKLYTQARGAEQSIRHDPSRVSVYFDAGLYWKSIAELTTSSSQGDFFRRALAVYQAGSDRFGKSNILFYLNAGHVAERLGDYGLAEHYYRAALTLSPADESPYLDLVNLYVYQLHRSADEILSIFELGIKKMFNPAPLRFARANYLKRIGNYQAALEDYQALRKAFPNQPAYQQASEELQAKIRSGS